MAVCIDLKMDNRQCEICGSTIKINYMSELLHYEEEDYVSSEYGVHFFCGQHAKMYVEHGDIWVEEMKNKTH